MTGTDDRKSQGSEYDLILVKHSDLVDKFLEIAERKVSVLDDYGDENWDCLSEEIDKCLVKFLKREPSINLSKTTLKSPRLAHPIKFYAGECARHLEASLAAKFRVYHEARKAMRNVE